MTRQQITDGTGVVFKWGAIAAALISVGVWFNTRLSATEISIAEDKKDIHYIRQSLDEIKGILKNRP